MSHKQIVVTAKAVAVANHSKRSRNCSVSIAVRHGSIPGLESQTEFYSMLTVRIIIREQGGRSVKLTVYLCIATRLALSKATPVSPYIPSWRGQLQCPQQ